MRCAAVLLGLMWAQGAAALDLSLPANARLTAERASAADTYAVPVAPFSEERVPMVTLEGEVQRAAWRIGSPGLTTLQVLTPLRAQIEAAGYDIVLDCDARSCGGFDFRFAVEVLPAPNMYVNIRSFRYLSAVRGPASAPQSAITLMVSATPSAAFVQVVTAGSDQPRTRAAPLAGVARSIQRSLPVAPPVEEDFDTRLLGDGHVVLDGLTFDTGGATLGAGPFPAISALARFLTERADIRIALVGHTDSVGALDANIALSRQRARAVRTRLVEVYGIASERMEAEGMGYLAPVASNLEEAGRRANRRVEAVLLSAN